MSSRGTSSAKTMPSARDICETDPRWRPRAESEHSLNMESGHHTYPTTPGTMPVAYGQHQDLRSMTRPTTPERSTPPQQPLTHALPGGSGQPSPFSRYPPAAPGFPVQHCPSNVITPLPYNTSNPYPAGYTAQVPQPTYTTTTSSAYAPYNYNQRAYTTGSMYPTPHQSMPVPSTSRSNPYVATMAQSKSHDEYHDDCFNIFWLFFLLGPLTWPCGVFGVCSDKQSERMAGFISAVCLVLVIIAAIVVITQTPEDSDDS